MLTSIPCSYLNILNPWSFMLSAVEAWVSSFKNFSRKQLFISQIHGHTVAITTNNSNKSKLSRLVPSFFDPKLEWLDFKPKWLDCDDFLIFRGTGLRRVQWLSTVELMWFQVRLIMIQYNSCLLILFCCSNCGQNWLFNHATGFVQ